MTAPTNGEHITDDLINEETETSTLEFDVVVTASDWTLEVMASKFRSSESIIPKYQRKFVWDIRRASTLIESFAIGLPVPQVFFYENRDGNLEVIDGQQRITSIVYFFEGYFDPKNSVGKREVFRLKGLEQRKDLIGKSFDQIEDRAKKKIKNSNLRGVTIRQLTPEEEQPESVYHIFERLNTGGQPLSAQEIRNVVYRGEILSRLESLNEDSNWRKIDGKEYPDPKQRDIELILRLFSLYKNAKSYKPPMKDFLSRQMSENKKFSSRRARSFVGSFKRATELVSQTIDDPFRPRGLLNAATMEAVMVSIMEHGENGSFRNADYDRLLKDANFQEATISNTTNLENVKARIELAGRILFQDE